MTRRSKYSAVKVEDLVSLGPEVLAEALVDLAQHSEDVQHLVERLVAGPEERLRQLKQAISGMKRGRRFIEYRESPEFARKLSILVDDIRRDAPSPEKGIDLIRRFFETDNSIFNRCDDSMGAIGDVYRHEASAVFASFAARCADESKIAKTLRDLMTRNDYGARDYVIDTASQYLSETTMRTLVSQFRKSARTHTNDYDRAAGFRLAESLARQIGDAPLYKDIVEETYDELPLSSQVDIATVYLECGDVDAALERLDRISPDAHFRLADREQLYEQCYRLKGDTRALILLLRRQFERSPSLRAIDELAKEVGEEERQNIINTQIDRIVTDNSFDSARAAFLFDVDASKTAETYIVDRYDKLGDYFYAHHVDLVEKCEQAQCWLSASLLYRTLLIDILEAGRTKAYRHAVRYLEKTDEYAERIVDWTGHNDHATFKQEIHAKHYRKRSFWSKYSGDVPPGSTASIAQ